MYLLESKHVRHTMLHGSFGGLIPPMVGLDLTAKPSLSATGRKGTSDGLVEMQRRVVYCGGSRLSSTASAYQERSQGWEPKLMAERKVRPPPAYLLT